MRTCSSSSLSHSCRLRSVAFISSIDLESCIVVSECMNGRFSFGGITFEPGDADGSASAPNCGER